MLLEGKRGLILGVANKRSIAWGIAQSVSAAGARLALTYQGERLEENVRELAASLKDPVILPCDVSKDEDLDALAAGSRRSWAGSTSWCTPWPIALREELDGEFLNTSREGYRLAQDISSYSLTALAKRTVPSDGGRREHRHPLLPGRRARGPALQRDGRGQGRARDVGALPGLRPRPQGHPRERHLRRAHQDPRGSGVHGISKMLEYHRERAPLRKNTEQAEVGDVACSWCRRSRAA
jgi:enoyl-[acyl-carrier protein] reductase I